jgi:broad specificity phosphatase PhoE
MKRMRSGYASLRLAGTVRFLLTGLLLTASPALAQRAVFVVRHAEKVDESRDPLLSPAGQARAAALARHLKDAGVTAAFVTDLQRTRLTAAPLTDALGIKPIVLPAAATQEMVDRIRRDHAQDVVLVVGHSNTVPAVLKLLGHTEPVTIRDDEYDALFVLMPRPGGPPGVVRLRF